MTTSGIAT